MRQPRRVCGTPAANAAGTRANAAAKMAKKKRGQAGFISIRAEFHFVPAQALIWSLAGGERFAVHLLGLELVEVGGFHTRIVAGNGFLAIHLVRGVRGFGGAWEGRDNGPSELAGRW